MTEKRPTYETDHPQPPNPDLSATLAEIAARIEQLNGGMQETHQAYLETIRELLGAIVVCMDRLADARRWARAWKQGAKANHDAYQDAHFNYLEAMRQYDIQQKRACDAELLAGEFADTATQQERERCADIATAYAEELVPFRSLVDKGKFAAGHAIGKAIRQEPDHA